MSLTFDFPQWKIKVEGSQASAGGTPGDAANKSADAKPWEEDLADLDDLASEDDHDEPADLQTHGVNGGEADSDVQAAGCQGSSVTVGEGRGAGVAPHCYAPAAAIRGDAIPSEVLLLVLSGLRDVGDCVRASLVCRHWYAVAAQSNELWHVLCTLRLGAGHTDGGGGSGNSGPSAGAAAPPGAGALNAPATVAPGALPTTAPHNTPGGSGVAGVGAADPSSGPAAAAQGHAAGLPPLAPPAAAGGCRRADPGAVLRPPPGCDHPTSRRLSFKTTRALTRIAVRFMVLRKGFEYVVEAAAALWVAAQQQAAAQHQHQHQPQADDSGPPSDPGCSQAPTGTAPALSSACRPSRRILHVDQLWESNCRGGSALQVDERFNAVRVQQMVGKLCASEQWALAYEGVAAVMASRCDEVAAGLVAVLQRHQAQQQRRALREQEQQQQLLQQVQEQQRRQEEADKQHNHPSSGSPHSYRGEGTGAVCKDGTCPGAQQQQPSGVWAAGKDEEAGVTPGMAGGGGGGGRLVSFRGDVVYGGSSYADQFAELLRRGDTQGALALSAASAVREGGALEGARRALKRRRSGSAGLGTPEEAEDGGLDSDGGGGGGGEFADEPEMRAVLVMVMAAEGGSYNPVYGTLYDGALASAVVAGDNAGPWRDSMLSPGGQQQLGAAPSHVHAHGNANTQQQQRDAVLPVVSEGLVLWRQLLQSWAVYRRWLEVLTVWCGPLGARVEAERQLAGAAAPPGQVPLALPHLTNKGLQLFRSNVLLAYPVRRPLQTAALWLSARATAEEQLAQGPLALGASLGTGWGPDGAATQGAASGSRTGCTRGDTPSCAGGGAGGGGGGGGGALAGGGEELCGGPGEEWRLLRAIRKVLTELSIADDATLPACQHTRDKLTRCFGRLLPASRGGEGPKGGAGPGLHGCMGGSGMKLGTHRGSGGGRGKGMML